VRHQSVNNGRRLTIWMRERCAKDARKKKYLGTSVYRWGPDSLSQPLVAFGKLLWQAPLATQITKISNRGLSWASLSGLPWAPWWLPWFSLNPLQQPKKPKRTSVRRIIPHDHHFLGVNVLPATNFNYSCGQFLPKRFFSLGRIMDKCKYAHHSCHFRKFSVTPDYFVGLGMSGDTS
jgi:hypothetical protein